MQKTAGFGFTVRTVLSDDKFSFVWYTFVDDSDVIHSLNPETANKTSDLFDEMQQVVDT